MTARVIAPLLALLAAGPLAAQTAEPAPPNGSASPDGAPRLLALRAAAAPPVVDGVLDEAAWAEAAAATDFAQMRPAPGEPATTRTEARVLYDGDAIYVGMRMYDAPELIAAQLARRDASGVFTDWAHVLIDSYHDRRTAFRFSVTPRGSKKDVLHFDDHNEDINWDAVWDVAVATDAEGWSAEFRIPLSQLRFSSDGGATVWGVNFGRETARLGEWSWWSPVLPTVGGMVSQSGELHGLRGLEPPRQLEVLPYTVARLTRSPENADNPFWKSNDGAFALGADLRYGLSSNVTLSATINPDFGQVEADPSVVNLSAFETFFPEKRPFFLEGGSSFDFRVSTDDGTSEALFYSRRVGRAPQRGIFLDGGYVDSPETTTILGAAKVTGKTAGGWTFGFLEALTAEEKADVMVADGSFHQELVEPLTSYAVGTVARDFRRGQSTLRAMATATNRRLDGRSEFEFLRSAAYTGGITGRHRFADGTWEASGYAAASHIRGSESAIARVQTAAGHYFQRPDADHLEYDPTRTSLTGALASFWVGKNGGGSVRGGFGGHYRSPGLELNDLGFQQEADVVQAFANVNWRQFRPVGPFRSFSLGLNPFAQWTTGGERVYTQLGHFANFELRNLWHGGWWIGRRFAALTNGATRGGPAMRRPGGTNFSFWVNTDPRQSLNFGLNGWGGSEHDSGNWNYGIAPRVTFRPSAQLNLALNPQFSRNRSYWQYVGQPRDDAGAAHYVFGDLDQSTVSLTARLNYTISPALSLELYAQPFISGGEYGGFKEVVAPRADEFDGRFAAFGDALAYDDATGFYAADTDGDAAPDISFFDPDFNFKQMRGNAVLRWEYRPGSTLFLVWGQSRTASLYGPALDDVFELGRDARRLLNRDRDFLTPVTNVFLIKLSYWLNP